MAARNFDTMVDELLSGIFEIDNSLLPPTITTPEEVIENDMINRSFHRTANSRAVEEKEDCESISLLRKCKQKGVTSKNIYSQPMKHHYT